MITTNIVRPKIRKFEIDDNVISKRIGPPIFGIVTGYMYGQDFYNSFVEKTGTGINNLDSIYPNWQTKYVYYLKRPKSKILSKDEFEQQKHECGLECDYSELPEFEYATYCEDDLELFK